MTTGITKLEGFNVLVLEDEYFLAMDTAKLLRGAGAKVLGPCPHEAAALALLDQTIPSAAVLDVELGEGRSFDVARLLLKLGVPFVFMTAYDSAILPADLEAVPCLAKTMGLDQLLDWLKDSINLAARKCERIMGV